MQVQVIDNASRRLLSVLAPALQDSEDTRIAVAFVSRRGLAMIEAPLRAALETGAQLEFLIGLDMNGTEPDALHKLYDLSRQTTNISFYCYGSLAPASIYHPKLYLLRHKDQVKCIVGSSNLTEGGLKKNIEVNLILDGSLQDETVSDIYGTYNRLKFHPKRVVPDDEFLALYAQLCDRGRGERRKSARDPATRRLAAAFSEKVTALRRPQPTTRDLVGWLRLVYQALPEGEFSNQQIYAFENEFRRHYPGNLNIEAKIRQQLQFLCHVGLIEHVATGRWRKV